MKALAPKQTTATPAPILFGRDRTILEFEAAAITNRAAILDIEADIGRLPPTPLLAAPLLRAYDPHS
jgi:hypothetical protein